MKTAERVSSQPNPHTQHLTLFAFLIDYTHNNRSNFLFFEKFKAFTIIENILLLILFFFTYSNFNPILSYEPLVSPFFLPIDIFHNIDKARNTTIFQRTQQFYSLNNKKF